MVARSKFSCHKFKRDRRRKVSSTEWFDFEEWFMNDSKTTTMTSKTGRVQNGKARGCQWGNEIVRDIQQQEDALGSRFHTGVQVVDDSEQSGLDGVSTSVGRLIRTKTFWCVHVWSQASQYQPLLDLEDGDQFGDRAVVGWILRVRSCLLEERNDVPQFELVREYSGTEREIGKMGKGWSKDVDAPFKNDSWNCVDWRTLALRRVDDGSHFVYWYWEKSIEKTEHFSGRLENVELISYSNQIY